MARTWFAHTYFQEQKMIELWASEDPLISEPNTTSSNSLLSMKLGLIIACIMTRAVNGKLASHIHPAPISTNYLFNTCVIFPLRRRRILKYNRDRDEPARHYWRWRCGIEISKGVYKAIIAILTTAMPATPPPSVSASLDNATPANSLAGFSEPRKS